MSFLYNEIKSMENRDDDYIEEWMQLNTTINSMESWLKSMNISDKYKKILLCVIYIKIKNDVLSDSEHDKIIRKEVERFYPLMISQMINNNNDLFSLEIIRISKFYAAWLKKDKQILELFISN